MYAMARVGDREMPAKQWTSAQLLDSRTLSVHSHHTAQSVTSLSDLAFRSAKPKAERLSRYLDQRYTKLRSKYVLLDLRLSLSEITSLFGSSQYLEQTFAQRIGSAKVESKVKSHSVTNSSSLYIRKLSSIILWQYFGYRRWHWLPCPRTFLTATYLSLTFLFLRTRLYHT